ncbi:endonuclease/exonuclease/phosphatase family protein [Telluribacter sp. SYSU D00476]|uniref:endonuclease/exonuclease/phosphatase family protein n=1 Tax=Telluribacter sp. SYSU D00476 TaxID=2811430 RepID=UPI001FF3027B|nr:endonuclease/exonuclease/phosphatase family protein [Telluribacter sp. SYSU D00476]
MKRSVFTLSILSALFSLGFTNQIEGKKDPVAAKANLKVMTYNIHHCNPPSEKVKIDVEAIARVINQEKPDLVALQEVDNYTERSGKELNQARELARLTGMKSFFMKALDHQGGEYGVAVLSRLPIVDSVGYLLPRNPELGGEDRAVAAVTVQLPNKKKVIFASTHLDLKEGNRVTESEQIVKHFKDAKLPMILAGDFNALPGSATINYFDQYFTRTCQQNCEPTIPVDKPNRTIDFIMYNPAGGFKAQSTRVISEKYASDHLPVVAELEVK